VVKCKILRFSKQLFIINKLYFIFLIIYSTLHPITERLGTVFAQPQLYFSVPHSSPSSISEPYFHLIICSLNRNRNLQHQQKTKVTPRCTQCSLCVQRSRRIECKLASWVWSLLLGACGQGSMPPGRTRRNQGLRRYPTQKGSPDAKRFSRRNPIG